MEHHVEGRHVSDACAARSGAKRRLFVSAHGPLARVTLAERHGMMVQKHVSMFDVRRTALALHAAVQRTFGFEPSFGWPALS